MRAKKPDRNQQHFAKGSTFETRDKVTELAQFDWPPMPNLEQNTSFRNEKGRLLERAYWEQLSDAMKHFEK